jgi:hypothetical protein
MGFLDVFRKQKPVPEAKTGESGPAEVGLMELDSWLRGEFGQRESEALKGLAALSGAVESGFRHAGKALEALDKAAFRADESVGTRVNMIKGGFVTKAGAGLSGMPRVGERTFRGFRQFLVNARKIADEAVSATPKQGYVLSTYFKQEGRDFFESFRRLGSELERMDEKLNGDYAFLEGLENVREKAENLISDRKQAEFLEKKAGEMLLKAEEAENRLKAEKERLEALRSGKAWKELEGRRREAEALQKGIASLEKALKSEAGGVSRLLKKVAHDTGDKAAGEFSERPLEVMLSSGRRELESMFRRAAEAVEKETVKAKPSEKRRLDEFVGGLPALVEKKWRLAGLKKRLGETEERLASSEAIRDEKGIRTLIGQLEKELGALKEEEQNIKAEAAKARGAAEARKKSIEEGLKKHGCEVRLRL